MGKFECFRTLGPGLPNCKLGPTKPPSKQDRAECMTEEIRHGWHTRQEP